MAIFTGIITFITKLLDAFNLFAKYNPPKTPEQKIESSDKEVDSKIQKEEDGARPTWGK